MSYFSIVIPTYNRAERLMKAIQSVLDQKFQDWEMIVVDDGSTDNTKEIVSEINDARIKYIYQENAERGAARNHGVKLAQGKYVFFLDSDDLIYSEHLEHAHEVLTRLNEPEFFHIRYKQVFPKGKSIITPLSETNILKQVIKRNPFACQIFLRKDIASEFPFSENRDFKIGEDWGIVLKIAVRYPLHFSNRVLALLQHHDEQTMAISSAEEIITSRDLLLADLSKDEKITPNILDKVYAELTSIAALAYAENGEKKMAFKTWKSSIKRNPQLIFTRRSLAILKRAV